MTPNPDSRRFSPQRWPVRWRIAAVSAVLTFVILVCFAVIVGRVTQNRLHSDFEQEVIANANRVAAELPRGDAASEQFIQRLFSARDAVIRIVDVAGNPLINVPQEPDLGPPTPDLRQVGPYTVASQSVPVFTGDFGPRVFIQYAESRESLDDTIHRLWLILAAGVLGGTLLAAFAGMAVASRAMRPISSLTAAAKEIAETRDPSLRLPMPETEDEVGELAETLDQMLRELDAARGETQQMIQAQRDFVADASHELRTPLTSILANLELLQARFEERDEDDEEAEIVAGALGSSRRMRRLVSDLLLLARADAGRAGPRRGCDLTEIAGAALAEVAPVAGGHQLNLLGDGSVPLEGNPDDLHRLALNLIENAVRHTPPGTRVDAAVYARDGDAVLEVSDNGPGLPGGAGEQLFERFVRGNGPADLTVDAGTGLGLAIVKAVASSHGGRVELGSSPSGGARFTVHLPLGEQDAAAREPLTVA
jgi:signal transduction histidine kinase